MVHMVEVINKVHAINLNYGTITRDAPVRSEPFAFCYWSKTYPLRNIRVSVRPKSEKF